MLGALVTMGTIFEAAGGAAGMTRIADAWHRRVMADPVVSHAFHGGTKPDHTDPETYQAVLGYWSWATWHPMYQFHRSPDDVPSNVPMPHWDWGATGAHRTEEK